MKDRKCNHYNKSSHQLLRAVRDHCQTWNCSPDTTRLLLLGLQHWPHPPIIPSKYPPIFKHLLQRQKQIGWKHLLYGRFTTEWIYIHESTANSTNSKHNDGERWLIELIIIIWTNLRDRWKQRNDVCHDDSATPTASAQAQNAEIADIYANQHHFNANCAPLFRTPLQHLLSRPRATIASWLDHNLPFLRRNRITPSPPSQQCPHSRSTNPPTKPTPSNNKENNENTNFSKNPSLTPIRLRSERVSSPRAVPSVTR